MIMKNRVSYEIFQNVSNIDKIINNLNEIIKIFEKENKKFENTLNDLVFINNKDHGIEYGEIGDKKYAHSA